MAKEPTRDDVLKRMLKTPPKPFTPKAKPSRGSQTAKPSKARGGKA